MGIIFLMFEYLSKYPNRWISSAFRSDCDAALFSRSALNSSPVLLEYLPVLESIVNQI